MIELVAIPARASALRRFALASAVGVAALSRSPRVVGRLGLVPGALPEETPHFPFLAKVNQEGLTEARALGIISGQPGFLALLAEAYRNGGQIEEGLRVLSEALAQVESTGECYYEAELYRLIGQLTLQLQGASPQATVEDAERCFLNAIAIACRQQAKMWELRATVHLARPW